MNAARFVGDGTEGVIEVVHKLGFGGVISVVRRLDTHVMPKGFDGVELRAVLGERAKVKAVPEATEPLPYLRGPVIGGVVVDQEDFLPTIALRQAVQKGRVASTLKHVAMSIVELGPVEIDGAKDLLGVPLTGGRNQGLVSTARPGLVEAGVLTETGFIGKQQGGVPIRGFFLALDRCSAASGPARPDRPWPTSVGAAAPKNPSTGAPCGRGQDDNAPQIPRAGRGQSSGRSRLPKESRTPPGRCQ